jgi:hypothetical protein
MMQALQVCMFLEVSLGVWRSVEGRIDDEWFI